MICSRARLVGWMNWDLGRHVDSAKRLARISGHVLRGQEGCAADLSAEVFTWNPNQKVSPTERLERPVRRD